MPGHAELGERPDSGEASSDSIAWDTEWKTGELVTCMRASSSAEEPGADPEGGLRADPGCVPGTVSEISWETLLALLSFATLHMLMLLTRQL